MMKNHIIYILDTTALIYYKRFEGKNITVKAAVDEVKNKYEKMIVDALIEGGVIEVINPPINYIKKAKDISKVTGDYLVLSETDIEIIALAIYFRDKNEDVIVVTDDYGIQNVLRKIKIKYYSLTRKIKKEVTWKFVCARCGKEYSIYLSEKINECPLCGGELIRRRIY